MSQLCMRWPKYWSFSFSIIPSKEIPGLISFRKDWLDLLAVQGTLKSLLQHHSSKASILQRSAFFTVQLSHPYMTTGKTIALTRQTLEDVKYSSLCFEQPQVCTQQGASSLWWAEHAPGSFLDLNPRMALPGHSTPQSSAIQLISPPSQFSSQSATPGFAFL